MDDLGLDRMFCEVHKDLPREGPGNDDSTRRAFEMCEGLPSAPRILDIGCGPGAQTMVLADATDGVVTAVDFHQPFLDQLSVRIEAARLGDRVNAVLGDMKALEFADGEFDLIWSEGAVYIMGFENGIRTWKRFLKPGGYLAVSELTRLQSGAPEDVRAYWEGAYPAIQDNGGNLSVFSRAGYDVVGYFELPETAWLDEYYAPMEERIGALRATHGDDVEALKLLDNHQEEIDQYRKGKRHYGYMFYVARVT
jgi:ubiquinone/menaquinone biosynthesis C-methylase UbiE